MPKRDASYFYMMSESKKTEKPAAGSRYEVTAAGSLGLLALGAKGIEIWRKKRAEQIAKHKEENKAKGDEKE